MNLDIVKFDLIISFIGGSIKKLKGLNHELADEIGSWYLNKSSPDKHVFQFNPNRPSDGSILLTKSMIVAIESFPVKPDPKDVDFFKLFFYLGTRIINVLEKNGITTVEQVTNLTFMDLRTIRGIGHDSAITIKKCLIEVGLNLKPYVENEEEK
jgi:hypothetical protein